MGYSPRYHVGYNRPVKGAIGDSPKEWHTEIETDELTIAHQALGMLEAEGKIAAIIDTSEQAGVTGDQQLQDGPRWNPFAKSCLRQR